MGDEAVDDAARHATARRLFADFSIEVTPKESELLPEAARVLPPGTAVYLTYLTTVDLDRVLDTAVRVRALGLRPVVHLAVRAIPDLAALDRVLGRLVDAGVTDLLLVAGSFAPAGSIEDTLQVLESAELRRRPFTGLGVAGHPEGNPGVAADTVDDALARKDKLASEDGLPIHVVTQFCFAAEPVLAWERRARDAGIRLPVHVGLPGLTSPAKLLRFGLRCGIGPSLSVLRRQRGSVLTLASQTYRPAETVAGLVRAVAADPGSLVSSVHFFPFGAVVPTATWATAVREGRFSLAGDDLVITDEDRPPTSRETAP
ncbi:methylenetetrahydrofolate reductase [Actinomycetospora sp. TBRC 11914]|uniref:methylenetetrahydrofolate reductase n=1 Tax=Actinomycetospora sp. TBRC 11914 TaxID=2729387 RepID=UPI00145E0BD9|nr:methylenetetrahydrofolate reductase [Actinomycetospora sp. TBRC 11914]NMO94115.1 methylenetetrahydrofolate reductase [Actinomycetospora sp. TBRC 11914]